MNPFTYYKAPETRKQAQSNLNYWCFEGMLSTAEMEELGHIPASYKAFINEMKYEAKKTLNNIIWNIAFRSLRTMKSEQC